MPFPGGGEFHLVCDGTRPHRNDFQDPWFDCKLTPNQAVGMMKSRKKTNEWAAEVVANGEVVERIWPSREAPVETVVV